MEASRPGRRLDAGEAWLGDDGRGGTRIPGVMSTSAGTLPAIVVHQDAAGLPQGAWTCSASSARTLVMRESCRPRRAWRLRLMSAL